MTRKSGVSGVRPYCSSARTLAGSRSASVWPAARAAGLDAAASTPGIASAELAIVRVAAGVRIRVIAGVATFPRPSVPTVMTVLIALEFNHSILGVLERKHGVIQVRTVVLIALLALVRKFIILDTAHAEPLTEDTPPGDDYLARLAVDWEREADAVAPGTRLAVLRTGIVLHPDGGALKQMLTPFRLGVGGQLGSGRQFMSWIHRADWVRLVTWLATEPRVSGAFNLTAPMPVTNAEFTQTLGRVLRRPAIMPVPALALRLLFGELADTIVTGQRVLPAHAERLGFEFRFRQLETALLDLLAPHFT